VVHPLLAAPSLNSPAANLVTGVHAVTFGWSAPPDPAGQGISAYQIQVDSLTSFSHPLWTDKPTGTSDAYTFSGEGAYYWRVRAFSNDPSHAAGAWSAPRKLVLDWSGPAAPVLVSPANYSATTQTKPVFTWKASPGASQYNVYLDSAKVSSLQTGLTYTPTSSLAIGPHNWSVQAVDAVGNSSMSLLNNFNVTASQPGVPPAPALTAPASNSFTNNNPSPAFTWTYPTGAVSGLDGTLPHSYEIQFSLNAAFTWLSVDGSASSPPQQVAMPEGHYYWRVRAFWYLSGTTQPYASPWSPVWNFTVDKTAPTAGKLLTPLSYTDKTKPTFSWTTFPGAAFYQVWIHPPVGSAVKLADNLKTTTFTPAAPLGYGAYT
jgi:hypothetical protein